VYDPSSPPEKVNKPWHRGQRVVRGGTWYSEPRRRNTAYRHAPSEHYRQITLGFRIVAELTRELKQAAAPPDPSAPPIALAPFDAVQARRHQETWAKHLGLPREWTNPLGMTFVLVPSGKFEMGSDEAEVAQLAVEATRNLALPWYPVLLASEQPKRRVTISEPFYLSKYETTVSQFRRFSEQTGYKPDRLKESGRWEWFAAGVDPVGTQPVVWVSDRDAVAFCRWLSDRDDASYELPTEAEWEYACRAGTTTRYSTGNDPATLQRFANVADAAAGENHAALQPFADLDAASKRDGQWRWSWASWNDGFPATAPVGRFKPNPFGLHDMHGNVGEICADRHDKDFYTHAPVEDPRNDYGDFAVVRGCGCIVGFPDALRSSYRHVLVFGGPGYHGYYPDTGFRVVLRIRARSNTAKPTSQ
jgi:formylglycine-generating enzyme required for sulfatase activity